MPQHSGLPTRRPIDSRFLVVDYRDRLVLMSIDRNRDRLDLDEANRVDALTWTRR
jgi:hypothetical protein